MSSNSIYSQEPRFCVYLTTYLGNKLPMFYIGSTSIQKINKGYHGTVSSKQYKSTYVEEIHTNPHLFKTKIILKTYSRKYALFMEFKLQKKLNVVKSPMYMNKSFAAVNGFHGMDTSGANHPLFGLKGVDSPLTGRVYVMSEWGKQRISETHADVSGSKNPQARRWKLTSPQGEIHLCFGNLQSTCRNLYIGEQLLKKHLNTCVPKLANAATHPMSKNTVGWKLELAD